MALAALGGAAQAQVTSSIPVLDDPNDFLQGVTGFSDLDFRAISVAYDAGLQQFTVFANVDGPFGATPGEAGRYVLGVDTGQGKTHPFANEPGVTFDQAFVITQDGKVSDPTGNSTASFTSDPANDSFEFSVMIPLASLTSRTVGVAPEDFGFNLWSQQGATHINTDFAPDNIMLSARGREFSGLAPVPEPTSWALMILGFGLAGATVRARRSLERRWANA
jgi:hypothetical protein